MCVFHIANQSLTNVSFYIQVYMQSSSSDFLLDCKFTCIYIHIYVQVAHNFDTFYAVKLKFGMIFT